MVKEGCGSLTHRLFSHIVNAVGTAVIITREKLSRKWKIEIGLCFGHEVGLSINDNAGFVL
jgi:hypothetical protein